MEFCNLGDKSFETHFSLLRSVSSLKNYRGGGAVPHHLPLLFCKIVYLFDQIAMSLLSVMALSNIWSLRPVHTMRFVSYNFFNLYPKIKPIVNQ